MKVQATSKDSTAGLSHLINSYDFGAYWQEYVMEIIMSLSALQDARFKQSYCLRLRYSGINIALLG
jgi:hypothetical protein